MMDNKSHTENQESIPSKIKSSRRRFLIQGAAVAPIVAAATSRPAWSGGSGGNDDCINSGTLSGNLSNHGCQAVGRSPGWWWNRNGEKHWVETMFRKDDKFFDIFGYIPLPKPLKNNSDFDMFNVNTTLWDLGRRTGHAIDKHAITAILNFSHPGIMYSGNTGKYASAVEVINAYKNARALLDETRVSATKDPLVMLKNELDSYSGPNGHDIYF